MRFFLFLIIIANLSFSQEKFVESVDRVNINLFVTNISYSKEFPISSKSTLEGSAG